MKIEKDKIRIDFDNAEHGLMAKGDTLTEFFIAGDDKVFIPASARIEGRNVVVWNKNLKNPVAVRFAFRNAAVPNLFSKEGLPVNPFRTDDWSVNIITNKK
jgi:sialate O-acetylesterase